ncbi:MAG: hypothetical protein FD123_732 [Bacteroidetes bacterium]|nr:MAG: hypothetical protein FD123_732 [Bacteroidota bacterium]
MKKTTLILSICTVLFLALTSAALQTEEICDAKGLKNKTKEKLDPYKYDSGKLTKVTYKVKAQNKETEVPVFIGEKYRMVFNTEALTKNVVISVYSKDKETKDRKALWTSKDQPAGTKVFYFEPAKRAMKYFVDYEIPAVSDSAFINKQECVVFMLGYK